MRIYELYQGEVLKAYLFVHDDSPKEWDLSRDDFQGQMWPDDLLATVEQAVDHAPDEKIMVFNNFKGFKVRQRPST